MQHSSYGWRFELAFDDVGIECVLNAAGEDCYLTIGLVSILPAWLLPRRHRSALATCEGVFDGLLRQLPALTDVTWS